MLQLKRKTIYSIFITVSVVLIYLLIRFSYPTETKEQVVTDMLPDYNNLNGDVEVLVGVENSIFCFILGGKMEYVGHFDTDRSCIKNKFTSHN